MYLLPWPAISLGLFCLLLPTSFSQDWLEKERGERRGVLCYVSGWAGRRQSGAQFTVSQAVGAASHCTHVVYAYMSIDDTTAEIKYADKLIDLDANGNKLNQISKLKQLKTTRPELKVLISIGGWSEGSERLSQLAASPQRRKLFIKHAVKLLRDFKLDGLDIAWQNSGQRRPNNDNSHLLLLKELKEAFRPEGWLLTLQVEGKKEAIDNSNLREVSQVVDLISLAAFDFHGPWEATTGIMAPLVSSDHQDVVSTVDYLLRSVADRDKVLLGLALYGYRQTVRSAVATAPDDYLTLPTAPVSSRLPPHLNQDTLLSYQQVCQGLTSSRDWVQIWDVKSQTPVAFNGREFISYENTKSLLLKTALVKSLQLGGVMIWSLDLDDFTGACGEPFPLTTAVSEELSRDDNAHSGDDNTHSGEARHERDGLPVRSPSLEYQHSPTSLNNEYESKKKIACYVASWGAGRPSAGRFSVSDIDSEPCTHIIYAFLTVDETTFHIASVDPQFDQSELPKLKEVKKSSGGRLKTLASVGGWNQGSRRFSNMALTQERRAIFISSLINFIKIYNLDGIDICWQFPGLRDGRKEDKENSVKLFREIKNAFREFGYLLTVHIRGVKYVIDAYNIKAVSEIVDFINLATFEYHGPWEKTISVTSPLSSSDESNVRFNVDYILKKGATAGKLMLGLGSYGHAYSLKEDSASRGKHFGLSYERPFTSVWTNQAGLIAYNEVCYQMKTSSEETWTENWDEVSQTPFAFTDRVFATYDNVRSLVHKAKLVEEKGLGGIMFWSLDMDDFRGLCNGEKYPLLTAVAKVINGREGSGSNSTLGYQRKEADRQRASLSTLQPLQVTRRPQSATQSTVRSTESPKRSQQAQRPTPPRQTTTKRTSVTQKSQTTKRDSTTLRYVTSQTYQTTARPQAPQRYPTVDTQQTTKRYENRQTTESYQASRQYPNDDTRQTTRYQAQQPSYENRQTTESYQASRQYPNDETRQTTRYQAQQPSYENRQTTESYQANRQYPNVDTRQTTRYEAQQPSYENRQTTESYQTSRQYLSNENHQTTKSYQAQQYNGFERQTPERPFAEYPGVEGQQSGDRYGGQQYPVIESQPTTERLQPAGLNGWGGGQQQVDPAWDRFAVDRYTAPPVRAPPEYSYPDETRRGEAPLSQPASYPSSPVQLSQSAQNPAGAHAAVVSYEYGK